MGYVTFETLPWLRQPSAFNRLYATVSEGANDEAHIRLVSDRVTSKLEQAGLTVARTHLSKTNEHPMTSTVQAVLGILGALGILIVFLSSALIANTLAALLNAHQRYIGIMKLVGGRSEQIVGMYLMLIITFSLLALLIAVPLGAQGAYALSLFVGKMMNFTIQGYRIAPAALIIQVVIALLVPLVAGLFPVIKGAGVTVQRAISGVDSSGGHRKKGLIDRTLARVHFLSRPYLISLRNTFRRRGRLLLTLITLTMAGAIFIAVFNVQAGLDKYISQIGHYFLADVSLSFDRPYRLNQVYQEAATIPEVQAIEGWSFVNGEVLHADGSVGDNLQILAPPAGSQLVQPIMKAGRWLTPQDDHTITVSETLLHSFPDLKPGDSLRLKLNGKTEDWQVAGIFRFIGAGNDSNLAYANYETISQLIGLSNRAFSYRISAGCNGDKTCQEQIVKRVDSAFRSTGYHVSQVVTGSSTLETAAESLGILVKFLLVMALLTAVVGSIGLTGTMGMNVLERTREIGVMRSIGAVDSQIVKSVIFEGMFIGIISWLFGAVLSFPITWLLSKIISLAIFHSTISLVLNWQGFVIWLGLVIILAVLASVLPARNASRLTIREVLAYE
jgi:putative ABC transport system permease protein